MGKICDEYFCLQYPHTNNNVLDITQKFSINSIQHGIERKKIGQDNKKNNKLKEKWGPL